MKKQIESLLKKETTYHSDGGTSGYLLSDELYESISQSIIDMVVELVKETELSFDTSTRFTDDGVDFWGKKYASIIDDKLIAVECFKHKFIYSLKQD